MKRRDHDKLDSVEQLPFAADSSSLQTAALLGIFLEIVAKFFQARNREVVDRISGIYTTSFLMISVGYGPNLYG